MLEALSWVKELASQDIWIRETFMCDMCEHLPTEISSHIIRREGKGIQQRKGI